MAVQMEEWVLKCCDVTCRTYVWVFAFLPLQGCWNQGEAWGALPPPNNFDGGLGLKVILWLLQALLGFKQCQMVRLTLDMPLPKFSASAAAAF